MGWFGQRQGAAPGRCDGDAADLARVLPQGTVMIEYRHVAVSQPVNLLRYMVRDPLPGALTLRLDPDGSLRVLLRSGARDAAYHLEMPSVLPGETVILRYGWDALRGGVLAATVAERGLCVAQTLPEAVPMTAGQLRQMVLDPVCRISEEARFLAVSDALEPVGPMPGLDGAARVMTPGGAVPLAALSAGAIILAADGAPAQVRWVGRVTLPALGSFRPVRVRAPFYGARQDLSLQGRQVICLDGSEVEYLFDRSDVAVAACDLVDGRAVLDGPEGGLVEYVQLMIDRAVPLNVGGLVVPGLGAEAVMYDAVLRDWSVLAGFPAELLPRGRALPRPVLQEFEAASLRRMRVA